MPAIPIILRGSTSTAAEPLRLRDMIAIVVAFGTIYGAVMGGFGCFGAGHHLQPLYSAIKVPLLMGVTFALTAPSFFVLYTLMGLRSDFGRVLRALAAAQAGLAITLASLAPFTALLYVSCTDYATAILFNGLMFAIATTAGQFLLRRLYRELIAANPRHRLLLRGWTVVYAFIAIQMAWTLRPFVGGPHEPTQFFRDGAWGNAYVVVAQMIWRWIR